MKTKLTGTVLRCCSWIFWLSAANGTTRTTGRMCFDGAISCLKDVHPQKWYDRNWPIATCNKCGNKNYANYAIHQGFSGLGWMGLARPRCFFKFTSACRGTRSFQTCLTTNWAPKKLANKNKTSIYHHYTLLIYVCIYSTYACARVSVLYCSHSDAGFLQSSDVQCNLSHPTWNPLSHCSPEAGRVGLDAQLLKRPFFRLKSRSFCARCSLPSLVLRYVWDVVGAVWTPNCCNPSSDMFSSFTPLATCFNPRNSAAPPPEK